MARLTGRTVLITGAASGIGPASARRLASDGARLVLADLGGAGVEKLAAELGQVAVIATTLHWSKRSSGLGSESTSASSPRRALAQRYGSQPTPFPIWFSR